jgi:DNA-binding transcriptional ArsR family regulator
MVTIELNDTDREILDVLGEGRNTPSNIARRLDYSREYVSQRLTRLRKHDIVSRVDRGLYQLESIEPNPVDPDDPIFTERPTFSSGRADLSESVDDIVYGSNE